MTERKNKLMNFIVEILLFLVICTGLFFIVFFTAYFDVEAHNNNYTDYLAQYAMLFSCAASVLALIAGIWCIFKLNRIEKRILENFEMKSKE